ncbi:MAG: hypothetical protein Q8R28_17460, partial [Dehalococcoidia bacterium]|nr:hypothetical protein [Dehalococcoidia bacterium]
QLPPDLALLFPQDNWRNGIGGLNFRRHPEFLADASRIDVTEQGVLKLARETTASTVDSNPDEFVPSGFAVSGSQLWSFIGRDAYSWDFTNKNWDIQTEPVAAARIYRNGVSFDGNIYVPSWADDVGSGGSFVSADEPISYLYKTPTAAQWTVITTAAQALQGCKYMAVAGDTLWGGYWADAVDTTFDTGPTVSAANASAGDNSSDTSVTLSHTVPAGNNRLLIVMAATEDAASGTLSATYGGVAMTSIGSTTSGVLKVHLFRLIAPVVGAANVVVTSTATEDFFRVGAFDLTDVNQTTPVGGYTGASGTSDIPSVNPTSTAGDIIVGAIFWQSNPTITLDTGVNDFGVGGSSADNSMFHGYRYVSSGGDVISGTLGSSQDWIAVAVAVKPEIAAATTIINLSADPTTLAAGDVVRVDSELMLVTATASSPPTMTVVRGYRGSVAASQTARNVYEITENPHQVRSTADGSSMANWSTATSVGDSGSAITGLVGVGNDLIVIKTDGIYRLEADGTVTNLRPEITAFGH